MSDEQTKTTLIKVGFHVPGTMAAATAKGIELGEPKRRTTWCVQRIQEQMHVDCPGCGTRSGVDFSAGLSPAKLYKLALSMEYHDFFQEVERRYCNIIFTCPHCGYHGGHLPVYV